MPLWWILHLYPSISALDVLNGTFDRASIKGKVVFIGSSAAAPLHDIGKVGVPDNILLKPGKLTPEEFELMKLHAQYGKNIVYSTAKKIEGDNFLVIAGEIASTHHEKWDGTGYPQGLAGQNIPLSGRIMTVGDVYDALSVVAATNRRSRTNMRLSS